MVRPLSSLAKFSFVISNIRFPLTTGRLDRSHHLWRYRRLARRAVHKKPNGPSEGEKPADLPVRAPTKYELVNAQGAAGRVCEGGAFDHAEGIASLRFDHGRSQRRADRHAARDAAQTSSRTCGGVELMDKDIAAAAIERLEAEKQRRIDEKVAKGEAVRVPLSLVIHDPEQ